VETIEKEMSPKQMAGSMLSAGPAVKNCRTVSMEIRSVELCYLGWEERGIQGVVPILTRAELGSFLNL